MIFWYLLLFPSVRDLSCNKAYDDDDIAYGLVTAGNNHNAAEAFHAFSCDLNADFFHCKWFLSLREADILLNIPKEI